MHLRLIFPNLVCHFHPHADDNVDCVDNDDENYEEDDDVVPTIASPSRPPSLEFSSSITCCTISNDDNFDYLGDDDDYDNDDKHNDIDNLSPQQTLCCLDPTWCMFCLILG